MTRTLSLRHALLTLPVLLILSIYAFIQTSYYQAHAEQLVLPITIDLILTVPIVYFLTIRRHPQIPRYTVISCFVICVLIASLIMPSSDQDLLRVVRSTLIPVIELSVLGVIIYKSRQLIRSYREQGRRADFHEMITLACQSVLPARAAGLLATELSVIYYLLRSPSSPVPREEQYSYYQKNGIKATLIVFIFLIAIETGALHFLLAGWSPVVAWILTILSIYTGLQIIALLRSIRAMPIYIDREQETLELRYGFFSRVSVPLPEIESITAYRRSIDEEEDIVHFSPLGGLSSHNILLTLQSPATISRIYGMRTETSAMTLWIDQKEKFINEMEELIAG